MRLLYVEDKAFVANDFVDWLLCRGFNTDRISNDLAACRTAQVNCYDVVLVDWRSRRNGDGLDVCRHVHREHPYVGLIILTSRVELTDKLAAFDAGVDDYLVKPIVLPELEARIVAVSRRLGRTREWTQHSEGEPATRLSYEGLEADLLRLQFRAGAAEVELTRSQWQIVTYLLQNAGRWVPAEELRERALGNFPDPEGTRLRMHVKRLRKRLGERARLIRSEARRGYGIGVKFDERKG